LPDFSERASLVQFPELMDQPCSYEDLRACLRSIAQVNRLTGAYHPTLHWLDYVYSVLPRQTRPVHIVDVGCGYGDVLRRIHLWAEEHHLPVQLTGIDLNPSAIRAAREATVPGSVTFLAGNAFDFAPPQGIDIVINSLLMHHLASGEIIELLHWMEFNARMGWFINDLHRQPLPYHFFRLLARFTTWHPFVKHDGPVSILRSFRVEDWRALCRAAAIPQNSYIIREYRPARLCVARLRLKKKEPSGTL
jgi:SAM-dependent methyltransferase